MCSSVTRRRGIIVELKQGGAALAQAVVQEIRRAGAAGRVCLGSFSLTALRAARASAPEIATSGARFEVRMALYRSWLHLTPGRVRYQAFQVPEISGATRVVSPRFVQLAHKAGLAVQVWTVDEPDDMRRLLDWGVDGIISDRPDVAAEVVREWSSRKAQVELVGTSKPPEVRSARTMSLIDTPPGWRPERRAWRCARRPPARRGCSTFSLVRKSARIAPRPLEYASSMAYASTVAMTPPSSVLVAAKRCWKPLRTGSNARSSHCSSVTCRRTNSFRIDE